MSNETQTYAPLINASLSWGFVLVGGLCSWRESVWTGCSCLFVLACMLLLVYLCVRSVGGGLAAILVLVPGLGEYALVALSLSLSLSVCVCLCLWLHFLVRSGSVSVSLCSTGAGCKVLFCLCIICIEVGGVLDLSILVIFKTAGKLMWLLLSCIKWKMQVHQRYVKGSCR